MTSEPQHLPAYGKSRGDSESGGTRMSGTSHDSSTFNQVAGDQYNIHLPPLPPQPTVCTLPADTIAFTGRASEVANIIAAATAAVEGCVVSIHAIDGMPGVGKSALAVRIGHLMVASGLFPDRQLFLDLHAHTLGQQPTDPSDALAILLAADGVDARYLPGDLEGRAAMWRDRTAGKRLLLILDNAASSDQVAPLLPGVAGCAVLVTSRRYLGDLLSAVMAVPLGTLPSDEAAQMFIRLAPRATTEPLKVSEMVRLCGHLPLAISLLASLFTRHLSWSMDDLIEETRAKLLTVSAENRTVAAAFGLSYQYLTSAQQRFFRYLGLNPGVDIDPYAAAALTGLPLDHAADLLDRLHSDRLLDEPVYHRYRMHDLIREYAHGLAIENDPAHEREDSVGRLLDYYQQTAEAADSFLAHFTRPPITQPITSPAIAPDFPDRHKAHTWMDTERANLIACIEHAVTSNQHARVIGLTASIASYLHSDGPWTQASILHTAAVAAAEHLGDPYGKAGALSQLGNIQLLADDYPGALATLGQALEIYRSLSNRLGEANALYYLGVARYLTDDSTGAIGMLEPALEIYRSLGDRLGEANALHRLGIIRYQVGEYPGAAIVLEQALDIYRSLDDRLGEANTLNDLGVLRNLTGDYPGAVVVLEQALDIFRSLGDRLGEANSLNDLGFVRNLTGDYPSAAQAHQQALLIYRELGSQLGEANALNWLGEVQRLTGDYLAAVPTLEQALRIFRDLGSRLGEAGALNVLGAVRQLSGEHAAAAQAHEQALSIYHDLGDRLGEAEALNHMGRLHLACGDPTKAQSDYEHALELASAIKDLREEARALEGIGRCAQASGNASDAAKALRKSLKLYQSIGAPEASRLASEVGDLQ